VRRPPSRRAVLGGAAATIALAAAPACRKKAADEREAPAEPARPPGTLADHLRHLALVVGPWAAAGQAAGLLARYLSEDRLKLFAPDSAAFAELAARFADRGPAAESIDLAALTAPQRAALVALTTDLYAVMEVRTTVAGIPDNGVCLADPGWHSRPPGG
jgi:hypothetical protein